MSVYTLKKINRYNGISVDKPTHFRKALVFTLIFIFIEVSIIPSMGGTAVDKNSNHPISDENTLYVGGSGSNNYTSIQDAIDNASNGNTIFVYDDSSPYYENVYIRKSINLIGENKCTTVIDGGGNEYVDVVYISTQWVNISGFTIQNSGITQYDAGIEIHSNYNTIEDNIIKNNMFGIWIWYNSNTIQGNNISNNWYGIESNGNSNIIQKNNFLNNYQNAFFRRSNILKRNLWRQNYWNKPQLLPKIIRGEMLITLGDSPPWDHIIIPWFNIDWRPALKPYDI